jgi:DNA polymerase II small subunit
MNAEQYTETQISKEFAKWKIGVTPSAAAIISEANAPGELIQHLGETADEDVRIIQPPHVEAAVATLETRDRPDAQSDTSTAGSYDADTDDHDPVETDTTPAKQPPNHASAATPAPGDNPPTNGTRYTEHGDLVRGDTPEERWTSAWTRTLLDPPLPDGPARQHDARAVSITGDITDDSRTTGEYEDFQRLFRDRHKRLRSILEDRMPATTTVRSLDERLARRDKPVGVIGLVNEVRKTKNGHDLVEIEDTTGTFPVLFAKDYTPDPIKDQLERIITDEVIGFVGSLADDAGILFGDEIYFPDMPPMRVPNTADRHVEAVLLSDLHVGAVDFAADEWQSFVNWMYTDEAERIEYVLIAGDLVEGTGVYPGQEKELDVVDIYDQYQLCAEALAQLPDDVDIYAIMGNHDTVRLAEPQPVIKDAFKEPFADNVHFAGNPATFDIEGVQLLLYHGMSLNPLTDRTPGLDIHQPTDAMQLLLEKRHLSPMYGMNVRLAPESTDYLLIDDVPDVLHTGHVHTFGVDTYKNVLMMNTGCWQYQTDFQQKLNVEPDVGYAPVLNLQTLGVETKRF